MRSLRLLALLAAVPAAAFAQTDVEMLGRRHGVRPPPAYYELLRADPYAFQFSRENGWTRRARAVASRRDTERAALAQGALFAPMANKNGAGVLRGTLRVPVFLPLFSNTDSAAIAAYASQSTVQDILFRTTAAPPYSVTTYYREISNDSLEVTGTVLPWKRVPQSDTYYENGNNGLTPSKIRELIVSLTASYDAEIDFGQFDNDGPDGIPNSLDDDGFVDALVILHPEVDGACGTSNIWAHKWTVSGVQTQDASNVPGTTGGVVKIRDYIIQGAQGGASGCSPNQPPAIGLVTHELGHIFNLPDLYDTNPTSVSHGIGEWGLMGSGNWRTASSPAHMEAWSRAEVGWITEVVINRDTTLEISPIATSDTAYILPIAGTSEYYLLENRQRIGSDAGMRGPGLLIWHIDSVLAEIRGLPGNSVNAVEPNAVRLIQADGRNNLKAGNNRADAGDPWPGDSARILFGANTNPATNRNNGTPTFIEVRNITQVTPGGAMRVDIVFGKPALIAANDTLAQFRLDGTTYRRFFGILAAGSSHTLEMDTTQLANNGGNRYTWLSWSNGQPRSHTFTAAGGDTITAQVKTEHLVKVTISQPFGTVTSGAGDVIAGQFVLKGDPVQLVATPDAGSVFEGWSGDVVSTNPTLNLTMNRPYRVTAGFAAPLVASGTAVPAGVMGATYSHALTATGGTGSFTWQIESGALPTGLQLAGTGTISGRPAQAGQFDFVAKVTSGAQTATQSYSLAVTMPALTIVDVVTQIVGAGSTLTPDHVAFLDLVGNKNNRLDVGDFLGWIQATGQTVSASVMRAVTDAGGGQP